MAQSRYFILIAEKVLDTIDYYLFLIQLLNYVPRLLLISSELLLLSLWSQAILFEIICGQIKEWNYLFIFYYILGLI